MRLIDSNFEILPQGDGLNGIYKQIELASRTCYTPDTEVLTDNGWKRIDNMLATDRVVSYNPDNNTIIYDKPNLIVKEYCDDMIEIDHPNIKMCVTKDHRIYQSVPEKRSYTFLTASQLAGIEKIPHSKQCRFRIPKYFIGAKRDVNTNIPSIVYSKEIKNGNRRSSNVTIEIPCNKDFMVIAGAFIAEGHTFHGEPYRTGSYCQITQKEDSELYNNVLNSLNNLGWRYTIDKDSRKPDIKWIKFGTNQCWVMAFDDLFGRKSSNKHLPVWFRILPDEYLKVLIQTMYLGDGSHNTTRNERYLSISKRLLEEVQEVFLLLGKNGTVNFNNNINQMCYFEESHRDSWIISRNKHVHIFPYNGKVYCTSTKSGIICIRYKGKACWCGNCYKSEDKITPDSAEWFVERMITSGHRSMLEHGTVYLTMDRDSVYKYKNNPYSRFVIKDESAYVTTNYRVLVENGWPDIDWVITPPTEHHKKRITVRFICDRGVSHEFVRHRAFSFAQESTRYCNYSKDKFGNELTFIKPSWLYTKTDSNDKDNTDEGYFENSLKDAECCYFALLELGWKPQQARQVLPNAVKTELVMTGFIDDWEHFFELRCAPNAHPDAKLLADKLKKEFIKRGYIDDEKV